MSLKIIFGIGVLIGVLFIKKANPTLLKLITIGLGVSYVLSLITTMTAVIGFICFGFLSLVFGVYSVVKKLWLNAIIAFFVTITITQAVLGFSDYYYIKVRFLLIIPILCYILICINRKKHLNEFSVLTILMANIFASYLDFVKNWF